MRDSRSCLGEFRQALSPGARSVGAMTAQPYIADPYPTEAFHRGEYHRLRVGGYRVTYLVADDVITVQRVDRVG
jgi:hypothetical protein